MARKVIIAIVIVIVIVIGGGARYYFSQIHHSTIEKILSNPKAYAGKVVTIGGEVTDRTSFFVVIKFYKVKDTSQTSGILTLRKYYSHPFF